MPRSGIPLNELLAQWLENTGQLVQEREKTYFEAPRRAIAFALNRDNDALRVMSAFLQQATFARAAFRAYHPAANRISRDLKGLVMN